MLRTFSTAICIIFLFSIILAMHQANAQDETDNPGADPERIARDVYFLASDELEGRLAGTPGCEQAAEYIAAVFESLGLVPADTDESDYFQEFDITTGVSLGDGNRLEISSPDGSFEMAVEDDYTPLFFSSNGAASGDVVFAGYGITAPQYDWDDYANIDVDGRIVFCLRGEPRMDDPESPFDGNRPTMYSGLRWKAFNAQSHGASALILVTGPANLSEDEEDELMSLDQYGFGESGIPVIQVRRNAAECLWSTMEAPLGMFQGEMDRHMMPFGTGLENIEVELTVDLVKEQTTTWNVAGKLPTSNFGPHGEWVIIGAHYDHIGWGTDVSLHEGDEPAIHNGADDNASGTAGVLELARMFFERQTPTRRNIMFICFSAEELGILGSSAYTDDPLVPIEDTIAMINMDMIGRVRSDEDGTLFCTLQGLGSAEEWEEIVPKWTPDGSVALRAQSDPLGGSDYTTFYLARVPVLNFFSGLHDQYNRPTDDAELINYEGEASVLEAIYEIASSVANLPDKLTFTEWEIDSGAMAQDVDTGMGYGVYLGTVPDFVRTEGGFWIEAVTEGSPADEAGLKGGDRILKVGDYEVGNIYDYTFALGQYEQGDTVDISVMRD